jgi:ABC-type phosphate transport system permease subunit
MKGTTLAIIGVAAVSLIVVGIIAALYLTTYNNLVTLEAAADAAMG